MACTDYLRIPAAKPDATPITPLTAKTKFFVLRWRNRQIKNCVIKSDFAKASN